ncbi:transposase, IS605 OrfB family [Thermosinus carboxydivorans Nor1]|uniref:Transposase, IS605 OrfB family n=1 Tax=Thermosinus carboxydivorans Nor1 TaxID=401526 RepID=A1HTM5_9FIRM|nr:zinc ribbon domain-containing protein [Thermosinus carboxydivorans]EAX46636.1 transposase, IS605 OrfB family [Thermosinus carboxydivorans Nor1]
MQTITLKIKLLSPNKGKLEKMVRMLEIYHQACSWFLAQAEALNTASRAVLNRETYKQASGLFDLNRGTLQCAMLKALSARRSYLSRKQRGKKASLPKFETMVPVMVRQDCYSLHQLPSGTWVIKFPVSSGRSQIAVPIAASLYHARKLIDLARGVRGSKKFNRMLSGWNFKELASFIEYKAALAGVLVFYVDPKETSKTCPKCGNVSRCNRKTQGWFKCIKCGYQSDADRVGALNIAAKALNALGA